MVTFICYTYLRLFFLDDIYVEVLSNFEVLSRLSRQFSNGITASYTRSSSCHNRKVIMIATQ
jgi:hypothetical protein